MSKYYMSEININMPKAVDVDLFKQSILNTKWKPSLKQWFWYYVIKFQRLFNKK
jgi:hypothetical protein